MIGRERRMTRDVGEGRAQEAGKRLTGAVLGARQYRGDGAEERKLNEHARRAGHAACHRIDEAPRPPLQHQRRHDEQKIVGVEIRDRRDEPFGREFVRQEHRAQHGDEKRRKGLYSSHSPGRVRSTRCRGDPRKSMPSACAVRASVAAGAVFQAIQVLTSDENDRAEQRLPQENRLAERDDAGLGEQSRGHAGRRSPASCAADEDRPSAQTDPKPVHAAAPAAR